MSAYATHQCELDAPGRRTHCEPDRSRSARRLQPVADLSSSLEFSIVDQLVERLAERVATVLTERLSNESNSCDEWLDSRHAAEYLGVHRDTLRKLAAERAIHSEQDAPGCKLYFRRADLDAWRRGGGRPRHLASVVAEAA